MSVSRDMQFSSTHLPGLGPTWFIPPQKGYLQTWWLPAFSSVQFRRSVVSNSLRPNGLHHTRLPCPSPTPGAYSNSCPLSQDQESVNHVSNHAVLPSLSDMATSPSTFCRASWVPSNDLNGRSESQIPGYGLLLTLSNRFSSPPRSNPENFESQGNLCPTSIFWLIFKVKVKSYFTCHIVTFLFILTSGEHGCFL